MGDAPSRGLCSCNQAHLDPRVRTVPGTPIEPEALICVPLIARGQIKGALNIYREGDGVAFSETEFEIAKRFGDAAALALDNAEIRERLEHQAPHRLADRPLQPQRLLRAAAPVAAGVEPHAQAAGGAHARHRRLQARQRRARPRRRRRAAALPRRGACARSSGRTTSICRLGGEEFAVVMDGCGRRGCGARRRARAEPAGGGRLPGHRPDDRLGRARPRARARHEPTRAGGVRGGRDDDGEGAGQEPGRPLRRGRGAAARCAGRSSGTCARSRT